jgi:hypothetical protein
MALRRRTGQDKPEQAKKKTTDPAKKKKEKTTDPALYPGFPGISQAFAPLRDALFCK